MISKELTEEKATKTSLLTAGLIEKAPAAILKLKEKNGDPMLITIAEMSAVAFVSFNGAVLKGDKAAHARALSTLMKAQPTINASASPRPIPNPIPDPFPISRCFQTPPLSGSLSVGRGLRESPGGGNSRSLNSQILLKPNDGYGPVTKSKLS
jgi:hypothetical protein